MKIKVESDFHTVVSLLEKHKAIKVDRLLKYMKLDYDKMDSILRILDKSKIINRRYSFRSGGEVVSIRHEVSK